MEMTGRLPGLVSAPGGSEFYFTYALTIVSLCIPFLTTSLL